MLPLISDFLLRHSVLIRSLSYIFTSLCSNMRARKRLKTEDERTDSKDDELTYKTVYEAARANCVVEMKRLIKKGYSVNVENDYGWRPIHEVAYRNNLPGMKLLLKKKATKVNCVDRYMSTPLLLNMKNKDTACSELLIKHGARVNQGDTLGTTPLLRAIELKQCEQLELLLKHGASLNHVSHDKETPLFKAVVNDSPTMIQILLRGGARVENRMSMSVLQLAARHGRLQCLECLLEHIKNTGQLSLIDQSTKKHLPPLAIAAMFGFPECVRLLLAYRADPNKICFWIDKEQKVPLHYALEYNTNTECLKLLLPVTDHEIFKSCRKNPFYTVMDRGTSLDLNIQLTKFLIEAGLDVNELYDDRDPVRLEIDELPFHLSFFEIEPPYDSSRSAITNLCLLKKFPNRTELANILLDHGALVDARTSNELPPILPALQRIALAKVLIRRGANLNVYHPTVVGNMTVLTCVDKRMWKPLELILYAGAEVDSLFKFACDPLGDGLSVGAFFWNTNPGEIDEMLSFILQFASPITLEDEFVRIVRGDVAKQKVIALAAAQFTLQNICRQKIRRQIPHKIMFEANVRWYEPDYVKPFCLPPSLLDYVFYKGKYRRINRRKY